MKKVFFLLLISTMGFGQTIELQEEVLSRKPCLILESYKDFKSIVENNRLDYVMVTNCDTVNVFYYNDGNLNILKPSTTDVFLATRDSQGKVVEYPLLFFDRSSWYRKVMFRVGICEECKTSTVGIRYGSLR
jgi:hypothetical protein